MTLADPIGPRAGDALLLVDLQNDYMPGGSLGVAGGDQVLGPINRSTALFERLGLPVFLAREWHPPAHCSFREQGGPWPRHRVSGTAGAAFAAALRAPAHARLVSKATRADQEADSAFAGTDLLPRLRALNVSRLFIAGLATDYSVLHTVEDALAAGIGAVVLRDAVAAVDLQPGDGDRAKASMRLLGARLVDSGAFAV